MTAYKRTGPDGTITLRARAEGAGGLVGDLVRTVRPGESDMGRTYAEWAALPDGPVEVPRP